MVHAYNRVPFLQSVIKRLTEQRTKKISGLGLAGCCALALVSALPARAQFNRWYQLSEQAVQLKSRGKEAEALPIEQQAEKVAEATWGQNDQHVGLSLNVIGILEMDLEKFSDAEANLRRALAILSKLDVGSKDTAAVLGNLGLLYRSEAHYADAEKMTQMAMAIHEKVAGPNDGSIATDAGNLAAIYDAEGKYAEAEPLYQRAIAIEERVQDPEITKTLNGLGQLYEDERKYLDAENVFLRVVAFDIKALGKDHPQIAVDLQNLGVSYMYQGKFTGAEPILMRALQIASSASSPDRATVAMIEQNMGALYRDEGKYPAAEKLLSQALVDRAKALGPGHPDVAMVLQNLGDLYEFESRYGDAERALRQSLTIDTKSLGATHIRTAEVMLRLAKLYGNHGQWGAADQFYHDAIPIYVKTYGQMDVRVADVVFNGAEELLAESKFEEAAKGFTAAAAIYQKAQGDESVGLAHCYDSLGAIAEDGGKHEIAESMHKRALAILEKVNGPESGALTNTLEGLARVYKDEQKFADAEPLYLRFKKIEQAVRKPGDPELRAPEADLAALYFVWGKPAQAVPYFQTYLGNLMDEFRSNAATMSERDRLFYFATQRNAFPLFFSFVLKYHEQVPELSALMYDALLEEKGLIAASAAAMRAAVVASGDPQAVEMLDKLASDKEQLAALVNSSVGDAKNYRDQINQLGQEANTLEQSLMKRSAAMSQQKTLNAATWRDVQKALKPGEAAVEVTRFQVNTGYAPVGNFAYVALVVTPDCKQPAFVLLGDAKNLEARPMLAFRDVVARTRGFEAEEAPATTGQGSGAPDANAAYEAFWKPLEPTLGAAKRVYISPDGVLNTIPIGVIADGSGKLLLEKYQLRIVNSTKDLLAPARPQESKNALLVGNPKFDLSAAQQRSAVAELRGGATGSGAAVPVAEHVSVSTAGAAQLGSRGGDLKGGDLNPLPGTQVEVDAVNKLLKGAGWQATEYTGELALKQTMIQAHAPRLVHIATHGFFLSDEELTASAEAHGTKANVNEDPMLRSGLFFAGADRTREGSAPEAGVDDGVLTAYEASQLNLQGTELVVLSACETGLGKELNSDGVFGLRRGLQEAGAGAVLMSMWSVPDQETQELMALFYQKWLGGMEKPEALRQAQLEERETVRKRYGKDLPFYWGAFVLVGR